MNHQTSISLDIYQIRDILREDQSLFEKTIDRLKQQSSLTRLDADQPQRHLNEPGQGWRPGQGLCHKGTGDRDGFLAISRLSLSSAVTSPEASPLIPLIS